ncbi:hypothetical protein NL676_026398 [Syzygium grande]|nr:hypothetical protein NL676_026398 [Syzygium grande]
MPAQESADEGKEGPSFWRRPLRVVDLLPEEKTVLSCLFSRWESSPPPRSRLPLCRTAATSGGEKCLTGSLSILGMDPWDFCRGRGLLATGEK